MNPAAPVMTTRAAVSDRDRTQTDRAPGDIDPRREGLERLETIDAGFVEHGSQTRERQHGTRQSSPLFEEGGLRWPLADCHITRHMKKQHGFKGVWQMQ